MSIHKKQVYAGLLEILQDSKYYYNSSVGASYSHLTEDGKAALLDFIEHSAPRMLKKQKEEFELKAKEMVWDELKK
jgi:hypothetical protein